MRRIAIINQKGGCGKTTTAINLAGTYAARGTRVLLVDMDPQSHCAAGLAIPEKRIDLDIGDAMLWPEHKPLDDARLIWRTSRNLDLIPSRMKLAGLEAGRGGLVERANREGRLLGVLKALESRYDVCLIDCAPSIGLLTYNSLVAADEVLIPVDTSFFSLQGASKQVNTLKAVNRRLGVTPAFWLVATIHDVDSALSKDLLDELRSRFPKRVSPAVIRRDQSLKEAASFGQPVSEYAPKSVGAADYASLADWLEQVRHVARRTPDAEPASVNLTLGRDPEHDLARRLSGAPAEQEQPRGEGTAVATRATTRPASRSTDVAKIASQLNLARSLAKNAIAEVKEAPAPATPPEPGVISVQPLLDAPVFGPRVTPQRVTIVQPLFLGRRVWVAGDFNGWKEQGHELARDESRGVFEITVKLPPGRHMYRLVIDGRWAADPFNSRFELNPFGEPNSVVDIPS